MIHILHKKSGVFYKLPSNNANDYSLNFKENLVCILTQEKWRLGKSILIACEDKLQAKRIDEALWMNDCNSFLPHNLFGAKTKEVPIVLYWSQCSYDNTERNLLINLMKKHMNFFINFNEIIDFVPTNNNLKKWARIRYKFYKNIGFNLNVTDAVNFISN